MRGVEIHCEFGFWDVALFHKIYNPLTSAVKRLHRECAIVNVLDGKLLVVVATIRHFQVHARINRLGNVVGCAPVGHYQSVKAPFGAKDVGKQALVLCATSTIEFVVGIHDAVWLSALYCLLEGIQVDFA